jgi:hypothetical protein
LTALQQSNAVVQMLQSTVPPAPPVLVAPPLVAPPLVAPPLVAPPFP